ncbi:MAG TPA: cation diffusion facilitator family transporter [Chthoniobacterales bacterium]|nr:cation diffusion facilitator family transporter [Chthoniobacterales bacterium]
MSDDDHQLPGRHHYGGFGHSHAPPSFGRAFAIGMALNIGYVFVQVVFGIAAHSLALVADAGHNLGDVLGLALSWLASYLTRRPTTDQRTYGLGRSSILAALANAIFLLVTVGGISWEAIRRFSDKTEVAGWTVVWVAALGVIINLGTALLFQAGRHRDLNIRGAFLHMAADAAVSVGVVVTGVTISFTGWHWLDPIVSLIINAVIVYGTWGLLCDSFNLAMDAVPRGINLGDVRRYLQNIPAITDAHHLHIWALSTTETALTVHLVKPDPADDDGLLRRINHELAERFGIGHATIQFERQNLQQCQSDHEAPEH